MQKKTFDLVADKTIIGVVGAGNMGAGIAQKYATEGFPVVVIDMSEEAAARGKARVAQTLTEGVARKIFSQEQADGILGRMTFTADKKALANASLVVEAVFEDKKVKQDLFVELEGIVAANCILATNTSSFYVADLAAPLQKRERFVGLHYFYHPAKNRLVEVIAGKESGNDAVAKAWAIQELVGKTPIHSEDAPGFIVNRFFVPWLNESMRLVAEGVADIATVEAAAKESFGVGMGPFELMNVTGVPITLHAATTLGEELGAFYAPCDLIRPVVAEKRNWDLSGTPDQSKFAAVADRLWGVVCQIACRIVFDEKVCSLEDCDLGARVGLRWPVGPFEAMNRMGTKVALSRVEALAKQYADRPEVAVPATLRDVGSNNQPFSIKLVEGRVEDGVGYLTINRPDAMNALNEAVMEQIDAVFTALSADDHVKGIVVEGKGKAFVAGADTKFFVDQIDAGQVERIVHFASAGQDVLAKIDRSSKPVVCKLHGLSLGGGSELALACDYIVAGPKASFGFPETGIGIYPGLGGTQRSARRVGVALARWLVLTGDVIDAKTGLAMGLFDALVPANQIDEKVREFALSEKVRPESAPPEDVKSAFTPYAEAFAALSSLADVLAGRVSLREGADGERVKKSLKKLGFKAPLALAAADALLLAARDNTLAAGLAAETAGLQAIFSSKDAYEGLSTIGVRRPAFQGK